ncbi:MAG: hypothetical protein Q4D87_02000 [Actinomycetaceae bacterium]|nr:hypothetical protein [Actinomycetaceae bacterium]
MFILAFLLGVVALAGTLWLRRDTPSSRSWETQQGLIDERFAFVFLPSFTVLLFGLGIIGISGLFEDFTIPVIILFAVGVILTGIGTLGSIIGLFSKRYPLWLLPQWRLNSPHRK